MKTEIVKVTGCDSGCPFTDWSEPCYVGGSKWKKEDRPYPPDCPLLKGNIQVELEKEKK